MRKDLIKILCCPVCKGDLVLSVTDERGEEVLEGTLRCAVCRVDYPINEGIPNLLPETASED
ncbi:methytransferase partner Trm112 [Methanoculleus sp.]|uniref:methytransferase partner Trm112 n=1 Tax=Methanoculleus sp. TaxID=90427 RepID=UPI0025D37A8D|nr:methytransferase partner Trm112 [Methanoculleus sp.]